LGVVIPTYWNVPGIILNDETYLYGQVSLFFYLPEEFLLEVKTMGIGELAAISIGVSMDAFAIAVCKGLSVERVEPKHLLAAGLWFGGAQAVMPLLGYFLGSGFRSVIESLDHWISLILLAAIGIHMIRESREPVRKMEASFAPRVMLPLAVADSIDALAVGVSFAFLKVDILPAVLMIGLTTFAFSVAGVKIGNQFGARYKSKAETVGGIILLLMGTSILWEHLRV
jgi:putative Mn2+ efflux pump MntP